MAGLAAIVDAVAFKMDGVLRPVLGPVASFFFKVANAIFEADGAMGTLIGTAATIGAILLSVVGPATLLASKLGLITVSMGSVVSAASTVVAAIGTVVGAIASLPLALVAAIGALAAFAVAYLTNWRGTRDKTNAIINQIKGIVKRGFINFINAAIKFLKSFVKSVKKKFGEVRNKVTTKLNNLVEDAKEFGKDLVSEFASGIRDKIGDAIAAASELASEVRDRLPGSPAAMGPLSDLDETGPGLVDTFIGGIDSGQLRVGLNGEGDETNAGAALSRQEGRTVIEIEGRQVERATRDFRSDGTDLRGRYG
jgi:polyhydroxyalkanoate synthesis regulator phasin